MRDTRRVSTPEPPEPVVTPRSPTGGGGGPFGAVFIGFVGLLAGIVVAAMLFTAGTWATIASGLVVGLVGAVAGWFITAAPKEAPGAHRAPLE